MTRRGLVLFIALGVVWGVPYLFIKIAVGELSPEFLALARCALAAALLLPIALHRKAVRSVLKRWRPLLIFAVIEIVLPWYFLGAAEVRLPSSTTGLLLSSIPIVAVGIAFLMGRRDRLTGRNWVGIALGTAGVAAIVGFEIDASDSGSVAMLIVVVVGYALGPAILSRYMHDLPGVGVMALALAASALIYVPVVAATGGWPAEVPSAPVISAVLVLAVLCSAVAFLLMFALIAEIGPIRMTAITYVNPAVAVIAGALVLSEPITIFTLVGFALILLGCALVTQPDRRPVTIAADAVPVPAIADEVAPPPPPR